MKLGCVKSARPDTTKVSCFLYFLRVMHGTIIHQKHHTFTQQKQRTFTRQKPKLLHGKSIVFLRSKSIILCSAPTVLFTQQKTRVWEVNFTAIERKITQQKCDVPVLFYVLLHNKSTLLVIRDVMV
jgi:hypothetical protein